MKKFLSFFFPSLIILTVAFLSYSNYVPNTILTGWDALHPEFNFPGALSKAISGVWREDQGVGAIAAHSHMADLPRIFFLWISSFILPVSMLRYFYIFLCLAIGPLGVYFFLKYVFQKDEHTNWIYFASFLGGLFYLLNFTTVQNFYVPFEMFTTAYAFLPWILFSGLKYLREGGRKKLVYFAVVLIFASPMAYAATLWYAIMAGVFLFLATFSFISTSQKLKLKRFFTLGLVAFFLNLYWILPNIYSIAKQGDTITNSQINKLFSPEAFLRNQDYGTVENVALQKNFLFKWLNYDFGSGEYKNLLNIWASHLESPGVINIAIVFIAFWVSGVLVVLFKKERVGLALITPLILTLFFLLNANPPLGNIYLYLYDHIGLFREGFRMPFTKFSILFSFIVSFYFSYFILFILVLKNGILRWVGNFFKYLLFLTITLSLIYFGLPAFRGNLIGDNVKLKIPSEYFEAYKFLNTKEGRIAKLPLNSLFNWEFHNWGFEGSAWFTWFLSDNPQFDRDFDRWSKFNEDFYKESSFALYANHPEAFFSVLEKYKVKYLLLDESIFVPGGQEKTLLIPEIKQLLNTSNYTKEIQKFGFLTIYETNFDTNNIAAPIFEYQKYLPESLEASVGAKIKENLNVNRGFPEAYNCDISSSGSVEKSLTKEGILYKADNGGVSCDFLDYPDLPHNVSFNLKITGENKTGRGLKVYLFNHETRRVEVEELLPSGSFDVTIPIYAKNSETSGYTLNFETRSFGRIGSTNLIKEVQFLPAKFEEPKLKSEIQNNLQIQKVNKLGPWGYKVNTKGEGILELGQSFEKGWIAVSNKNWTVNIFEHFKLDEWANGWKINSDVCSVSLMENCNLLVAYWPQLLEWIGLIVGGFAYTLIYLSI